MPELTQAVWTRIEAYSQGKPKRGLSWGISRLDSMTYGLCPGNFVVLAAETSQGKTVLGTQVAKRAALAGHPVLYVSLEMSDADIIERALLSHAGVDMSRAFAGQIDSEEWERLGHAAEDFYSLPIHMETQLRTDSDVVTATKRGILQHGIELVVVDYLQLLRHSGKSWGPKDEVTQVSHNLALLAHNTNVPVLCLSQLSRAKDPKRPGTPLRPTLSRLKESGDIENDADKVVLIWNPKAGLQDVVDGIKMPVQALLIDAKHRGGPKGECPAWFEGQFARFIDCDDRWQDPEPSPDPFAAGFGGRNWWTD